MKKRTKTRNPGRMLIPLVLILLIIVVYGFDQKQKKKQIIKSEQIEKEAEPELKIENWMQDTNYLTEPFLKRIYVHEQ